MSSHEAVGNLHLAADAFADAAASYRAALAAFPADALRERARLLLRVARAEALRFRLPEAAAEVARARALATRVADPVLTAQVAVELGQLRLDAGDPRRALRYARYAWRTLRGTDEHLATAQAAMTTGLALARSGRPQEALDWLQDAAATYRRLGHADGLVRALNNLGLVHKNLREWREAVRCLEQALAIVEREGLFGRMRQGHQHLGLIRWRLGEWARAEEHFGRSLRIARDLGHASGEAAALLGLGLIERRRHHLERAEEMFRDALEVAVAAGARREVQLASEFLAEVALDRGDATGALALLEPALAEASRVAPEGDVAMELHIRVGSALRILGREGADLELRRGLALAERAGDAIERALAQRELAWVDAARGDADGAEARLRDAALVLEQLGDTWEQAVTLASWPGVFASLSMGVRQRRAIEPVADAASRAAALFERLEVTPLAAHAVLSLAGLEVERERIDHALALLEQAEQWLAERPDAPAEARAAALRRLIEGRTLEHSLSSGNEFRALEEANRLFRETADVDGLLAQVVRLAVEHAGGDRGFVAFSSNAARLEVVAQHGMGRDRARRVLRAIEAATSGRLVEDGPVFSSRVAADARFAPALADALAGVGSLVCVPLHFPSQSVGLVYVDRLHDHLLGAFRQRELNRLAVLVNSAAVAVVESQRSRLLAENQQLRDQLRPQPGSDRVVSQSREVTSILALLRKVADSPATVLFVGETGTGKGLFAQVVHEMSERRDRPFVQVNCAALPEHLLESELFGYVQGAFTGATRDKPGLFEEAAGGTLFLDEIEKIPESVQAKLLSVLDRGEIRPVGATRTRKVDARVICATGADLRERIRAGRFLEDLYYRLNDITVRVPALRERREDVPLLAQHFLERFSRQLDKPLRGFRSEVLRLFLEHEWRGNVRELEKTVKRMVVLAEEGDLLGPDLLPVELREAVAGERPDPVATARERAASRPGPHTLRQSVAELERQMISDALTRFRGNKARVARELGLSYPTLLGRIRTYGLEREES